MVLTRKLRLNGGMNRLPLLLFAIGLMACHGRRTGTYVPGDALPQPPTRQDSGTAIAANKTPVFEPISNLPPPKNEVETSRDETLSIERLNGRLRDVFFDYDSSDFQGEALAALREDAELLRPVLARVPALKLMIQGHCDERGSSEYNLALGDRRARRTVEGLAQFNLPLQNPEVVSYGKEAPQCTESNESCWRRNRRAHLVVAP